MQKPLMRAHQGFQCLTFALLYFIAGYGEAGLLFKSRYAV
jgi:hypothetical protein